MNDSVAPTRLRIVAKDLFLITLFLGVLYFGLAWMRPICNPDEGRYVEIPREMVLSGDYVTPRLNGLLYLYKPPLFYWLQAGMLKAAGLEEYHGDAIDNPNAPQAFKVTAFYVSAVRFVNSSLAILTCWIVYLTALALWNRRTAVLSGLVLGTSGLWFGLGQVVTMDMTVAAFITAACAFFIVAVREPAGSRKRLWCAYGIYVSMALAVLSKGLIGIILPGGVFFFWILLFNQWKQLRHLCLFSGILLFLIISVPWHVLAALATPEYRWDHMLTPDMQGRGFLWYYFIYEHFLRFTDAATAHRSQGWWFFFVALPVGMLPWLIFLPQSILHALKGGWHKIRQKNEFGYLFLWTLIPLLFFSASASKLIPYILPSMPPLALLIGYFLADAWADPVRYKLNRNVGIAGTFGIIGAMAVPIAMLARWNKTQLDAIPWYLLLMGACALSGLVGLYLWRRNRPRAGLVSVFACMGVLMLIFPPLGTYVQREDTTRIGQWLAPQLRPDDLVYVYNYDQLHDFPLHLKRYVGVVDFADPNAPFGLSVPREHGFGFITEYNKKAPDYVGGEVKDRYISMEALQDHLDGERPVFVLLELEKMNRFYTTGETRIRNWRLLSKGESFILIGNPAAAKAIADRKSAPQS